MNSDTFANGETEKLPPHNFEAEQALLGAVLVNNAAYDRVAGLIRPEYFADPVHGRIWEAIAEGIEAGTKVSPVTLKARFDTDGDLGAIGGAQYLARLAGSAVTIINAPDYARAVHDTWMRRELIMVAQALELAAVDFGLPAVKHLEDAEAELIDLLQSGSMGTARPIIKGIEAAMAKIQHAISSPSRVSGLRTDLADLDSWLGGLHGGELVILAGRPSMGKAQPLSSMVLTAQGWRPMGNLRGGDLLASHDGHQSRLRQINPQGEKPVYRVSFSDGRSTRCCGDHLWTIHYRDWPCARTVTTDRLRELLSRKRYKGRVWVPLVSGDFPSDARRLPIDPWLLGALLGDGSFRGSHLRFTTSDQENVDRIRGRLPVAPCALLGPRLHGVDD